jgi:hypothetical protein
VEFAFRDLATLKPVSRLLRETGFLREGMRSCRARQYFLNHDEREGHGAAEPQPTTKHKASHEDREGGTKHTKKGI